MLSQMLLTLAVVTGLSAQESGLWFVFMSTGGVLQLFYLGFSSAVLRNASHLHSGLLRLIPDGVASEYTEGHQPNTPLLKDFLSTMGAVYAAIALLVALLAWGVGVWVLHPFLQTSQTVFAWVFFVGSYLCQMFISLRFHFMQGVDQLPRAHAIMAIGVLLIFGLAAVVGYLSGSLMWLCVVLLLGNILHALVYTVCLRRYWFGRWDTQLLKAHWPNGLRAGVSRWSLSLIYHLPTIVISRLEGLALGGAYGFSAQICFFASTVAQLPFYASLPKINGLAGRRALDELRVLFCQKSRYMLVLYALLAVGIVWAGPWVLELIQAKTRLLALGPLLALVGFFFFETHRSNHVMLVSAFNRFPFWKADLLTRLAIIIGGFFILQQSSLGAFMAWMFICGACAIFWWPVWEGLRLLNLDWKTYLVGLIFRSRQSL